jgi:hypothetical protein
MAASKIQDGRQKYPRSENTQQAINTSVSNLAH